MPAIDPAVSACPMTSDRKTGGGKRPKGGAGGPTTLVGDGVAQPAPVAVDQSHLPVRKQRLPVDQLPDIFTAGILSRLIWRDHYYHNAPDYPDGSSLARWGKRWHLYADGVYREVDEEDFRSGLTDIVNDLYERDFQSRRADYDSNPKPKKGKDGSQSEPTKKPPVRANVTTGVIANLLQSIASLKAIHINGTDREQQPAWRGTPREYAANDVIAFRNGIVKIEDLINGNGKLLQFTPKLFTSMKLDFDYSETPVDCPEWKRLLPEVLNNETDSIRLLQQWIGYLLTNNNDMQKMLVLIGAKASGKGTIVSVIEELVGRRNYAGTSLQSLTDRFGLEPLLGKSVAVDSDVRISVRDNRGLILRTLLAVTGNNTQTILRKNQTSVEERLTTRFMLAANEMPDLDDVTGALKRRLLLLRFPKSFEGKEDYDLLDRLKAEMPGILQWAIEGLRDLRQQKRFTESQSGRALLDVVVEKSPIDDFAHERIVLVEDGMERKEDIVADYREYQEMHGIRFNFDPGKLMNKLYAIHPSLKPFRGGHDADGVRHHFVKGMRLVKSRFKPCPKSYLMGLVRFTEITGQPIGRDLAIDGAKRDGVDIEALDEIARSYGVDGEYMSESWSVPACASDTVEAPGWDAQPVRVADPDTTLTLPF